MLGFVLARPSPNKLICLSAVCSFVVKWRQNTYFSIFCHEDITVVTLMLQMDGQVLNVGLFVRSIAFDSSEVSS